MKKATKTTAARPASAPVAPSDLSAGAGTAPTPAAPTVAAPATTAASSSAGASAGAARQPAPVTAPPEVRAGSTDDNVAFDDYLAYRRKFLTSGLFAHDLDITERYVLRVVDETGRPVLGAKVSITTDDGFPLVDLRTYADGRTVFFPRLSSRPTSVSWTARISANGAETTTRFDRSVAGHQFTLPGGRGPDQGRNAVKLDVQFLIDTTGSMGDEIDRLRTNMVAVSRQIAALPARPDIRFAMTVYRDCGDAFVSRSYDFDADVNRFVGELNTVRAEGGGDEPEHLNQALHDAVTRTGWRGDDTIKLIFVVADAPPHLDYAGDFDYAIDSLLAARRGIKIAPIASSGSNPVAEYVFRQLAQLTTGRFVFLTYGADGASPGDRTNLNVDSYETLALDQLVVRLTAEEVAYQGPDRPALPALPSGPPRFEAPLAPVAGPPLRG